MIDPKKIDEWRRIAECYELGPKLCSLIFRESAREAIPALLDELVLLRIEKGRLAARVADLNEVRRHYVTLAKGCHVRKVHEGWPALDYLVRDGMSREES